MNREQAIEQLPETHAAAVRLRGRGFDDDAIATALSLPPEAVPELLRIADQKLATLVESSTPSAGRGADPDAKGEVR
jgi:DNA-directed RNA polymerase specialized sigma24 family protein